MKRLAILFSLFILLLVLTGLTGCGQQSTLTAAGNVIPSPSKKHEMDYTTLITALRNAGANPIRTGNVSQPFMSVEGRLIKVSGEQLQVFEYANSTDANSAASHISHDGSTFTTSSNGGSGSSAVVDWVMPPHLYKKDKIVVIYVGTNGKIMQLLTNVLGKQFAGM
jgi:hypothetical protein